ncbi:hypothetical protein BH10CHL1_BH10CHL1_03220 [soil metagenome]
MNKWRQLCKLLLVGAALYVGYHQARIVTAPILAGRSLMQPVAVGEQTSDRSPNANFALTNLYLPQIARDAQPFSGMQITFDEMNNSEPALAPDNSTIVYLGESVGQQDIYRLPSQGGTPLNLSNTPTAQEDTPVFSTDGAAIAFASNRSGDWDIYLMDRDGDHVRLAIGNPGTDEMHPAFLPDGAHLLFSSNRNAGNWDIYSATLGSTLWTQLTTDEDVERFPTVSADGSTIAFRREVPEGDGASNSEIYVMQADGSAIHRLTNDPAFDGYPVITPDGSGIIFIADGANGFNLYSMNLGGAGLASAVKPAEWSLQTPRLSADGRTIILAANAGPNLELYTRSYTSPLLLVGQRGFQAVNEKCDWEAGVLAYGWVKAWRKTHQIEYWQWLNTWVDNCLARNPGVQHVNDGLLGYAALAVYAEKPEQTYWLFAQRVADYFMNSAPRTADGTLTHFDDTVWDDTMVGVVPFLVAMSQVSEQQTYFDEAVAQVLKHANHLQDAQTGLYHHAWDESLNAYLGAAYWCRGNGWPLLADLEVLSAMPTDYPQRAAVLAILQRQATALQSQQAATGLWHTVVNRTDFYQETSGSAMIAAALLQSSAAGWLDQNEIGESAQAARLGVWRQVTADGSVRNVSAPTGPMVNETDYDAIPAATLELYGQGALLLMGATNTP